MAQQTELTVKTIRFYSDTGIVPPTDRSPTGYRLYGIGVLTRLDLVRTLRDLVLGLAVIRQALDPSVRRGMDHWRMPDGQSSVCERRDWARRM
ncbi:hypothetical protein GCM10010341_79240 [Streptomyces noursei]|nr:hypothetical protein GCM10010341_79240 [Streptomyces noursei]